MRRAPFLGTVLVVLLVAVGCSTPPWEGGGTSPSPTPGATSPGGTASPGSPPASPGGTPASPRSPTAGPTPENDLAEGSVHRSLEAGSIAVEVDYWSTLPVEDWTAAATKPLSVSVTASPAEGSDGQVFLTRATVTWAVTDEDATLPGPDPDVDESRVEPGYDVVDPSSYQNVFTLGTLEEGATTVTASITYELLLETGSDRYAKQVASDQLVIALN